MSWNYNDYLAEKLWSINDQLGLGFNIKVADEQQFAKEKDFQENTIYVVVHYLPASYVLSSKEQQIQINVLSEQNKLDNTMLLLRAFTEQYNWEDKTFGNTRVKQTYGSPYVISNFDNVAYGYRSNIIISGTLYIMEDIMDYEDVKISIDGGTAIDIRPISMNINYSMNGNTQQVYGDRLASTVKSVATFSLTMIIPQTENVATRKFLDIMHGASSGNTTFTISYKVGNQTTPYSMNLKLTDCTSATAITQIPSLQLGFIR